MNGLTRTEVKFLIALARYKSSQQEPFPDSLWLATELGLGPKSIGRITQLKQSLKQKGYLDERIQEPALNESATELIAGLPVTISSRVPLLGEVKAGRTRSVFDKRNMIRMIVEK